MEVVVEGGVFRAEGEEGIDLNVIWRALGMVEKCRPSEWKSKRKKMYIARGSLKTTTGRYGTSFANTLEVVGDYCAFGGWECIHEGYILVKGNNSNLRMELALLKLIKQIYPNTLYQQPFGNYVVDFYIPSLGLIIEYDEAFHEREINKKADDVRAKHILSTTDCEIFRIKEGEEWSRLKDLEEYGK